MTTLAATQPAQPSIQRALLLGVAQILIWGGSFFLLAVLAPAVTRDTGWAAQWVYGSLSVSLVISGLLAPAVGRRIASGRGNQLLLLSGFVVGLGLLVIAAAGSLAVFVLGWCVIGVGMAAGLYDALFATLGRHYGARASGAIVQVTLVAGFCTTVTWPLVSALLHASGWRTACMVYGLVLWLAIWPINRLGLPAATGEARGEALQLSAARPADAPISSGLYWLLAVQFTIGAVLMTAMSVQLIALLQARGLTLGEAVAIGAVLGPCQVGIRLLETVLPKRHPIGSALISAVLTAGGMGLLLLAPALALGGVVLYALGNGLRTILRGTLPLAIFGSERYPVALGRLALPTLIAQAVTPFVLSTLLQAGGATAVLLALFALSAANVAITLLLRARLGAARR